MMGSLDLQLSQSLALNLKVEDWELDFLIDSGITFSTIRSEDLSLPVSSDSIQAVSLWTTYFIVHISADPNTFMPWKHTS